MNIRAMVCVWVLTVICLPALPSAASDGWFGGSSAPAANGVTTSGQKSGLSAWLPSWTGSKPKPKSNKPSMLSSAAQGTKNAWNKTVSFINPFDNPPKAPAQSSTGANSSSWWGKKPEKEKPNNINDWLGNDRPKW